MPKDASKTSRAAPIPVVLKASLRGAERTKLARRIEELFRKRGARARILSLGPKGRVPRVSAVSKHRIVVAAGGDGTVATVAAKLARTKRTLGVLPLGTFNHFAKDVGIPLDLEGAVDVILAGRARRIDVAQVNGRVFLNNSSVGAYPEIVRRREKEREELGLGKLPAFALATARILQRPPLLDIELRVKGGATTRRTPGVFFGNNVYAMEGRKIGTRERLDAGRLSIFLVHATGTAGLLRVMGRALLGQLHYDPEFESVEVRRATLSVPRRRRLPVAWDGEISWMKTPLRYRILPLALSVLSPVAPKNAPRAKAKRGKTPGGHRGK